MITQVGKLQNDRTGRTRDWSFRFCAAVGLCGELRTHSKGIADRTEEVNPREQKERSGDATQELYNPAVE